MTKCYVVNHKTLAHRLTDTEIVDEDYPPAHWRVLHCDKDGFITWSGQPMCPVPLGSAVEVEHLDGSRFGPFVATANNSHVWEHQRKGFDIVKYRPVMAEQRRFRGAGGILPATGGQSTLEALRKVRDYVDLLIAREEK